MRRPILLAFFGPGLLGGCLAPVAAPSLMPRAVERQPIDLPSASGEAGAALDPALAGRLAPLVAAAEAGDRAFVTLRGQVETAAGRAAGSAQESEAWTTAQQLLSALETSRDPVRDAALQVEAVRQEPANASAENRAAVEAAATRIEALENAERDAVTMLSRRLG